MAELRLHFDLAHPRQRVWRALTERPLLGRWFMPTNLSPRQGSEFMLHPGTRPGFLGPITGEVVTVALLERLVMRWEGEKLYTRVSWELTPDGDGCRLALLQTGFVGAPAALRIAALRNTYTELFGERLPELLDRLAAGQPLPESSPLPGLAAPRAGAPLPDSEWAGRAWADSAVRPPSPGDADVRQRRLRTNAAAAAWESAARRGVRANQPGRARGLAPPPTRSARSQLPAAASLGGSARSRAAGILGAAKNRPGGGIAVPVAAAAWLRSVAIGGAAALLAAMVFAAVVYPPDGSSDPPVVGEGPADGPPTPGMALQPGTESPVAAGEVPGHGVPAVSAVPEATYPGGGADGGPAVEPSNQPGLPAPSGSATSPGATPPGAAPPVTPTSAPPPDDPPPADPPPDDPGGEEAVLDARMDTAGLPLVGGRAVQVTVNNSGASTAEEWTVTMQVGSQDVVNVTGAEYVREGSQATFTAPAGLAPGASHDFQFQVRAPLLGLLGARDPTGCEIDGQGCR